MAESIVTAAPRPPAARWRRWSFRAAAWGTSRATTSPTTKAELEFEPDTRAVNTCRIRLPTGQAGVLAIHDRVSCVQAEDEPMIFASARRE